MRITQILLTALGALFALLGIGAWVAPDLLAARFRIDPLDGVGFATMRADFGGMFLALAALLLYGVWGRRRGPLVAAAAILGAVVVGRLFGFAVTGSTDGFAASLPVEIVTIAAAIWHIRSLPAGGDAGPGPSPLRIALSAAVVVALAGGAFAITLLPKVQDRMLARGVAQLMAVRNVDLMKDDALRVAVCGSSSPLPSRKRAKACVAVIAGGKIYVVDTGPESVEVLTQWGLPLDKVGGVLLTHFHSDHIGDLGELNLQTWVAGRPAPLNVYGGPGVERVVAGFSEAYALDQGYRTVHHGPGIADPATWPMVARPVVLNGPETPQKSRTAPVLKDGALTVTAIELDHGPVTPAYAYRFDYKGRSAVITGDTVAHGPLATASKGVDLMVAEALARPMVKTLEATAKQTGRTRVAKIMGDIQSYHGGPVEMAELANRADVRMLVLYHLIPAPDNDLLRRVFTRGLDKVRPHAWTMADDGSVYTLPLASKAVTVGRVAE